MAAAHLRLWVDLDEISFRKQDKGPAGVQSCRTISLPFLPSAFIHIEPIPTLRLRLNELSIALIDLISAGAVEAVYARVGEEILTLQARLGEIDAFHHKQDQASEFLLSIFVKAEQCKTLPVEWDEKTVRHFWECVKVVDSGRLLVVFKGGLEREVLVG